MRRLLLFLSLISLGCTTTVDARRKPLHKKKKHKVVAPAAPALVDVPQTYVSPQPMREEQSFISTQPAMPEERMPFTTESPELEDQMAESEETVLLPGTGIIQPKEPPLLETETDIVHVGVPFVPEGALTLPPGVDLPEGDDEADIYLNFENTDLANFINYIAEMRKINIVPDKAIGPSKISLSIRKPLSKDGAWKVFMTVLEMAGFSIVKRGDVHKVIPKNDKLREALPAYINTDPEMLPDSDENIRFVTFLKNIPVADIKNMVGSMLGAPNSVVDQKSVNGLIITAKSLDIKSAMKVVRELDQTGLQESVVVMNLKRANATDVRDLFKSLIQKPETNPLARLLGKQAESTAAYFSPSTKIIADERSNKLILLGNIQSIKKIEEFISEHVDTELKEVASPLHVYELQYAEAEQVADLLNDVTKPDAYVSQSGQDAAKHGGVRGGVKYFRDMHIKAEKDGNRLIVSSVDRQDWELLKKTIADLDKPNPQTAIETLIISINSIDLKRLGGQIRNKRSGMLGKHFDVQAAHEKFPILTSNPKTLLGDLITAVSKGVGATVLTFGGKATGGIWGILQMIRTVTNATIVSQPFITVANKATGTVSIGETRRIKFQDAVSEGGTIQEDSATGFEDKKANTSLVVTPQINLDGIIKFDIEVILEEFTSDIGDRQRKRVKTAATVADGQVLVLGGFVKTSIEESMSKTPILGDIPGLGWLFKSKQRTIRKDYIFVFMCPTILRPRSAPGIELYTKVRLHEATDEIDRAIVTQNISDPVHNWFFNPTGEQYSHKVIDYSNARYQPTTVDIANDPFYRTQTRRQEHKEQQALKESELLDRTVSAPPISDVKTVATPEPLMVPRAPQLPSAPLQMPLGPEALPQSVETAPVIATPSIAAPPQPVAAPSPQNETLVRKRRALKELISRNPVAPTPQSVDNSAARREAFKETITHQPIARNAIYGTDAGSRVA